MKALIIISILSTIAFIFIQWKRSKNNKRAIIALTTFAFIITVSVMGGITRSVIPIFIAHVILIMTSWGSLIWYLLKDKYYWYFIFSPIVTILLFLALEYFTGSGNEHAIIH